LGTVAFNGRCESDPDTALLDLRRAMQVGHDDSDASASEGPRDDVRRKVFACSYALDRDEGGQAAG
jgi:hypothetical protein